jgi:hypothetical protein
MARKTGRNPMRESIAHRAARLMAEDGIEDFAHAKRKAARQMGALDARQLPDNAEIETALRQYRALFQNDHASDLAQMRQAALALMCDLAAFNPHLIGSLLSGTAGKYAGIHLQLFCDNVKSVEHYLLNRDISFRSMEERFYAGDIAMTAPVLICNHGGYDVSLTVLSLRELRLALKTSISGKPIERANADAVAALIARH